MPKITLAVYARRFIPKTVRTEEFEFVDEVEENPTNKQTLLRACIRAFGRCRGNLYDEHGAQIGWRFEGKEKDDVGDIHWWETRVFPTSGIIQVGRFHFKEKA